MTTQLPRTPSFRLDGRRALVTGASSGIGQGAAVALAEAGAHVVCAARGVERLEDTVAAMRDAGWSAEAMALDAADIEGIGTALSTADAFHILVNAAGTARHSPAVDTQPQDYDAVMDLNMRGAYFLSAEVARAQMAAGIRGSIIHISSQMGHVGGIDRAVYAASKHGLEGMVKSMAIEWGPKGIRVNTICPTFIRTPLTAPTFDNPERVAWIEDKIKLGRVGEVEDIMGAVVWLASDAASLVTGTSILVDGGWTAD
ncbi:SDR family oxidoreductase [Alphaproteobacteria bacterium GH1-50]|uniref:SDR family oxidoreductase n=1 Tax=Kangsaoukella pontilimi TaxID=2691042 RepID=A0A7C9MX32_9RHOB|nr:SDR family oxidoreductase [Kangsaoukella pontilimi]MXQ08094.1 SDR family oxidoreductase [Kangsaoukella pontilimi]